LGKPAQQSAGDWDAGPALSRFEATAQQVRSFRHSDRNLGTHRGGRTRIAGGPLKSLDVDHPPCPTRKSVSPELERGFRKEVSHLAGECGNQIGQFMRERDQIGPWSAESVAQNHAKLRPFASGWHGKGAIEVARLPAEKFEIGSQGHVPIVIGPDSADNRPRLRLPHEMRIEGCKPEGSIKPARPSREILPRRKSAACKAPGGIYNEKSGPLAHKNLSRNRLCFADSGRNDSVGAVSRAGRLSHRKDVAHFVHLEQRWRRNISHWKRPPINWGWRPTN
jgi:hypothetical protein